MSGRTYRVLQAVSLCYILAHVLPFVFGWLKPIYAAPVSVILIVAACKAARAKPETSESSCEGTEERASWTTWGHILAITAVVFAILPFMGVGGFSWQAYDYGKHNAFFHDFIAFPWPVGYADIGAERGPGMFAIYLLYYLPTALLGKIVGWSAAYHFSYIWAGIGVTLAILWFTLLVGKVSLRYALFFLMFGGLDAIAYVVLHGWADFLSRPGAWDYWMMLYAKAHGHEWMKEVFFMFAANLTFICETPHHVLPAWVCLLMLLYDAAVRRSSDRIGLLWACLPLSSTFVFIGSIPYLLVACWTTRLKRALSFENLVAAPILLAIGCLFILSNRADYAHGWLWKFADLSRIWPLLLLYYVTEFGVYVLVTPRFKDPEPRLTRIWWYASILCLLLLPWYHLGPANELTAKGAIPSIIVFQACIATTIRRAHLTGEGRRTWLLIALLCLGALAPVGEIIRGARSGLSTGTPCFDNLVRVDEIEPRAGQGLYVSRGGLFWSALAKPVEFQPQRTWRSLRSWDLRGANADLSEWDFGENGIKKGTEGIRFTAEHGGLLARFRGTGFDAASVAALRVAVTVRPVEGAAKKPEPPVLHVSWTNDGETASSNSVRCDGEVLVWVGTDSLWRGTPSDIGLSFFLPEDGKRPYEVCVSRIEFLQRVLAPNEKRN